MNPLIYIRLAVAAVVIGLVLWLGIVVNGWRKDSLALEDAQAERDQAIADLLLRTEQFRDVQEASNVYQRELADLRIAAVRERIPVVRLCRAVPKAAAVAPAERGPDEASPGAGPLPQAGEANRDIGPELFDLLDEADEVAAQLRALQNYIKATHEDPT